MLGLTRSYRLLQSLKLKVTHDFTFRQCSTATLGEHLKNIDIKNEETMPKEAADPTATSEEVSPAIINAADEKVSFAKLLRYSPFIQMGDPNGALVVGTIIETMDDNLFIDFGGKFHCVCKKPRHKSDRYSRGAKVKVRLIDLELASKFMGSEKGITLLEADGTLMGLYKEKSPET